VALQFVEAPCFLPVELNIHIIDIRKNMYKYNQTPASLTYRPLTPNLRSPCLTETIGKISRLPAMDPLASVDVRWVLCRTSLVISVCVWVVHAFPRAMRKMISSGAIAWKCDQRVCDFGHQMCLLPLGGGRARTRARMGGGYHRLKSTTGRVVHTVWQTR
jgi:hypothetical protein